MRGVIAAAIQVPAIQSCEVTAAADADAALAIDERAHVQTARSSSRVRGGEAIARQHSERRPGAGAVGFRARWPDPLTRDADVVVVGAGLAGLARRARAVAAAGASVVVVEARDRVGGRVLNEDIGGGQGRGGGRPVDRPDPGPAGGARRASWGWTRSRPTSHGRERDRVRRQAAPLPRHDPAHQPARAARRGARPAPAQPAGPRASRSRRPGRRPAPTRSTRRPPRPGCAGTCDPGRPDAARAGHRGRLGGRARGHVAAPHALLHPLGRQPRAALRHRGRGAAGPLRRRLAAAGDPHGRGARRASACCSAAPVRAIEHGPRRRGGARRRRRGAGAARHRRDRAHAGRPDRLRPAAARLSATSSPSGCRSAPWPSAWRCTTSRSGAPTASRARARATWGRCRLTFDNSPPDGSPGVLLGFLEGRHARRARAAARRTERRAAVIDCFTRLFGPRAAAPDALRGAALGRGGVVARVLRLPHAHRRLDQLRARAARADRARCTGPGPRSPRCGTATWTARCARGRAPRPRCSSGSEKPV